MKKVIAIVGPTGVGKTKLSVELAKKVNGEIINADSTQVYKGLDIATAKVTEEEKQGIIHHLFDIKEVTEDYTVYDYQKDSRNIIDKLLDKNIIPILVGGTGLYLKACLYNYQFNSGTNKEQFDNLSDIELYNKVKEIDPNTNIHINNRKRLIRAYQYYLETGMPFSSKPKNDDMYYDAVIIGLTTNRKELYERINNRVDQMIEMGLLEEAKKIYVSNIRTKAIMTPIGYKELFPYFDKTESLETCLTKIKQNSRHYAKRQYTWFNNQMNVKWFDIDFNNFDNTINSVIDYLETL